jgi:NADPH:quinone reductase-like Zn-dependent oxidoreductase
MPTNHAAFIPSEKASISVEPAPYTHPNDDELVVRTAALAFNPVDAMIQRLAPPMFGIVYPAVVGCDVAGEVVEVGSSVTAYSVGDRVLGMASGFYGGGNPRWAFQEYVVLREVLTSKIPKEIEFANAAVLPLGFFTAACGLFQKEWLGLNLPTTETAKGSTGEALLVWGAGSSVGSNAVQLAVSAGYEVITTASEKNFEYAKKLGASQVFDYHSETIVQDLIGAFKGKKLAGVFDSIGINGAIQSCVEVVEKSDSVRKFVASAQFVPQDLKTDITCKFIEGSNMATNGVGKAAYVDFLSKALAEGKFQPKPDPKIVGKGLESVQTALETVTKGMSTEKIVVTL